MQNNNLDYFPLTCNYQFKKYSIGEIPRSFGKREFKGGSPLATSKAHTAVAREGILDQLKKKFNKKDASLLSEDNILED